MIEHQRLVIPNGTQPSNAIDIDDEVVAGIFQPAAISGTINIEAWNPEAGAWAVVAALTFSASAYTPLDPDTYLGVQRIRLNTSTNQAAERTFVLAQRVNR